VIRCVRSRQALGESGAVVFTIDKEHRAMLFFWSLPAEEQSGSRPEKTRRPQTQSLEEKPEGCLRTEPVGRGPFSSGGFHAVWVLPQVGEGCSLSPEPDDPLADKA